MATKGYALKDGTTGKLSLSDITDAALPIFAGERIILVDANHPAAVDDTDLSTPFLTPSGAVDAVQADGSVGTAYFVVLIAPGVYDDNVTINYNRITLMGFGLNTTVIRPSSGEGLTMRPVDASTGPHDNRMVNLTIKNITVSGETAPASGVYYPSMCGNELLFDTCTIEGHLNVDTANYLSAQGAYIGGTASFSNVAGQWFNFTEIASTLAIDYDTGNQEPSDTGNYGWSPYGGAVDGAITLTNSGKIDARMNHMGSSVTLTDSGCVLTASSCHIGSVVDTGGGTITINGDFYDNTSSGLSSTDVQSAIDELAASGGTGDVVGPSSSTDNALVRFNSTTGKLIQNSGTTLDDNDTLAHAGRNEETQGSDVASATDLTLGNDGNCFEITGTTQVDTIVATGWQNGSVVTLLFTSTPTIKHNTAGTGVVMLLNNSADFSATAGSGLTFRLCEIGGTQAWREIGRMVP